MITIYSIYTKFKPINRALHWNETQAIVLALDGIEKPYQKGYTITAFENNGKYFTMRTQKSGKIKLAQHSSHIITSHENLLKNAKKIIKVSEKEAVKKGIEIPAYLQEFPFVHSHPTKQELNQLLLLKGFNEYLDNSFYNSHSPTKLKRL